MTTVQNFIGLLTYILMKKRFLKICNFYQKIIFITKLMSQISPKNNMHNNSAKYHWPPTYTFEVFALSKDVSQNFVIIKKQSKSPISPK